MKISKNEVDKMINEEFQKMWKKRTLSKRLSEINEALQQMSGEDSILSEVEASGMQKTSSATGLVPGEQPGVKFEKLNATTLKEDEEELDNSGSADMGLDVDVESPAETEMGGPKMGSEMGAMAATEAAPMGEFEAKFAELGKSIDAKLASEGGAVDVKVGGEPDADADDFEEVEVDSAADENPAENGEAGPEDTEKEEEFDEVKKETVAQEAVVTEMEKTSEEGIDGESVAQDADLSDPDGDMKKDTVVSEGGKKKGAIITEGSKTDKKNIFLEGKDSERQAKILAEQKRMRKFAGLSNEDEE